MERVHGSKPYRVILGKLKGEAGPGDSIVEQTYRYRVDAWTEAEARAHCRQHGGERFEPATRRRTRDQ
jgi:hypothetical protein